MVNEKKRVPCQPCLGTGFVPDQILLGRKARQMRIESKMSQGVIARRMGVTGGFLSALESGKKKWTLALWNKIKKACGVKP